MHFLETHLGLQAIIKLMQIKQNQEIMNHKDSEETNKPRKISILSCLNTPITKHLQCMSPDISGNADVH